MTPLDLLGWIVGTAIAIVATSTAAIFAMAAIGAIKAEARRNRTSQTKHRRTAEEE